ncbi:pyocin activator PrtN family protein [Algicola sagamiensis]|uniref:pyocin activator PrtN family protein n=1 Tax=Algicola sagamiensis TaxID=163869 RepID=UPI00037B48E3|nr:pyocin activator PrtN family protein [Algicola sagamiensis]
MKTAFILLAQYERAVVPIEEISETYFGCNRNTAIAKAKAGTLPVPAFRCGESQKNQWVIHLSDLAEFIDRQREIAKEDWVG